MDMMKGILKLYTVKRLSENEKKQVIKINLDNQVENGGQLHYKGILQHDFVVLAKLNHRVVGYVLLYKGFLDARDIYVMQVAIDKQYQHCGIGSKMYDYVYNHSKGFEVVTANVNHSNIVSQKFHEKNGFTCCEENNLGLVYAKVVEKYIDKTFEDAKPIYFKSKKVDEEKTL